MVLKIENAIKAKQKTNMKVSQTATPKLHRNVILRARSPLQLNKESITFALNEHSFFVGRTSTRRTAGRSEIAALTQLDPALRCDRALQPDAHMEPTGHALLSSM
jgi:hypothetical protein